MERKTAKDFPPEVMDLFNKYAHGNISRRGFLDRAKKYAVGGMSAAAMLEALKPNFALAEQVPKDDARIKASYQTYSSPEGTGQVKGYFALPANASGKLPAVLVIHENRGPNPYIEDVVRRLALLNFVAFAPDALTVLGGYPNNEEQGAKLYSQLDGKKRIEDMVAAAAYLKGRPEALPKIGAVGFCAGGGAVEAVAVRMPDLGAAVPFYGGPQPSAEDAAKIKAPMLLHYAEKDDFINPKGPPFEAALKAAGVKVESYTYPGTLHGFHNDTTPRFSEPDAKLAWQRTVDFFNKNLRA